MLFKRRRLGAVPAVLAIRLGAADIVVKSPEPSPLADAVQHGDAQGVQALLKNKVDVNAPQPDGATALHWAAWRARPYKKSRHNAWNQTSSRTFSDRIAFIILPRSGVPLATDFAKCSA